VLEGSHSFTGNPHVYPRMDRTILPLLRKQSPDGFIFISFSFPLERGSAHPITAHYSFIDLKGMKGFELA